MNRVLASHKLVYAIGKVLYRMKNHNVYKWLPVKTQRRRPDPLTEFGESKLSQNNRASRVKIEFMTTLSNNLLRLTFKFNNVFKLIFEITHTSARAIALKNKQISHLVLIPCSSRQIRLPACSGLQNLIQIWILFIDGGWVMRSQICSFELVTDPTRDLSFTNSENWHRFFIQLHWYLSKTPLTVTKSSYKLSLFIGSYLIFSWIKQGKFL